MRFAICDDDNYITGTLETLVTSCFQNDTAGVSCEVFGSAEEMLRELAEEPLFFHVYLLDIEMGEINGLQAAATIRKKDANAEIIFITSHSERMQEAFDVNAFHYLVKPLDMEKARQVLLRCIQRVKEKQAIFRYTFRKAPRSLYYTQILYFESQGREIIIHLVDGTERVFYEKLDALESTLPLTRFARVHKSYLVNMDSVETVSAGNVWFHSGAAIPISRKYHGHFNSLYRDYLLRERG